ncbi:hypothetical protein AC792_11540 [Arthrobacter sp. RIT-PI-e]|uniref:sulfate/molybdate ABC transporter ATP-binding protein n=1 Tax=Arthrobacter sp. RIT-PI-e TaxID=1681197 RepID=UPI000675ECDF|nr:ABC transporter ATP-binding protein [Arthrobacter sp. RIT-PI-e]KNC18531.1 hypothetical protein AC792_11540 [Arthrobacter sp. RIT-PI-e]
MSLTFAAALTGRSFDVAFELAPGQTLAVLGPNGAGKSTLLDLVAGLLVPTEGHAALDGSVLFDIGAGRRILTEPRHRGIALLAQDALLFPHLTALENVAFGPRSRGTGRSSARPLAHRWLERVGVSELGRRSPAQLSGGQAQRVALARALAAAPALLLLDEPLAALDVTVAPAVRLLLREVLADRSAVIVTHDPLDAFLLADRVLILDGGRVVEAGPTRDVLTHPTTSFGARLAGLNLVHGRLAGAAFAGPGGLRVPWQGGPVAQGAALALAVRPTRIDVSRDGPLTDGPPPGGEGPGRIHVVAGIEDVEYRGDLVRVHAGALAADVHPAAVVDLGLAPGVRVRLSFSPEDASIYPL